ncbi:MAG: hypothetical protein IPK44_25520 [Candidatus Accumulibacter sp.]|nr:hypothetical protein [Accumulibacter sp.]
MGVEISVADPGDKLQRLAIDSPTRMRTDLRILAVECEQRLAHCLARLETRARYSLAFAEVEDSHLIKLKDHHRGIADHRPVARLTGRQFALALTNGQRHAIEIRCQFVEFLIRETGQRCS